MDCHINGLYLSSINKKELLPPRDLIFVDANIYGQNFTLIQVRPNSKKTNVRGPWISLIRITNQP